MPLIHLLADDRRGFRAELLDHAGVEIELHRFGLRILLQALRKSQVPAGTQTEHFQLAALAEVAADLLRDPHPHVFDDLLRTPNMRHDLGDRFENDVDVADRHPLREQKLEDRLQTGMGDVRRTDLVDKALVLGLHTIEQGAQISIRQQLREIVADRFAEVGEQDGKDVDALEALA